jgi:hypothetical protein
VDIVLRTAEVGLSGWSRWSPRGRRGRRLPPRARARVGGLAIELVWNDRAEAWNNAYRSGREHFARVLSNGDTVHPASVEKTLLSAPAAGAFGRSSRSTTSSGWR